MHSPDAESASLFATEASTISCGRRDVELRQLAIQSVDQLDADPIDEPDDAVLALRRRTVGASPSGTAAARGA